MSESENVTTVRGTVSWTPPPDPIGDLLIGYTYEQAALLLWRAPDTVKEVVTQNKLPRYLVRGPGSRYCWIILLPLDTMRWLKEHFHGDSLRMPRGNRIPKTKGA